jgi:hypothetical protein
VHSAAAANWTGLRKGGRARPILVVAALTAVPVTIVLLKLFADQPLPEYSVQHFYIVSAASLLAAVVAAIMAVAAAQIGLYRVLLICLGFTAMGGIFAVHGLLTPGVIVPDRLEDTAYRVVGMSAFFSLAVPGLFFAASFAPGMAWIEERMPFWPAGWLVVLTVVVILLYGAIALLNTSLLSTSSLSSPPYSTVLVIGAIALLFFAALRQGALYRTTGLASQADLILSFVLLADAAACMALFEVWTVGWWFYHLLMLTAVCLALRALLVERLRGETFKSTVEGILELGSEIPSPRV